MTVRDNPRGARTGRGDLAAVLVGPLAALGGTGLSLGVLLGLADDKVGTVLAVVVALASYGLAAWIVSPFHSPIGDLLFLGVSSVPLGAAAVAGFTAGRIAKP